MISDMHVTGILDSVDPGIIVRSIRDDPHTSILFSSQSIIVTLSKIPAERVNDLCMRFGASSDLARYARILASVSNDDQSGNTCQQSSLRAAILGSLNH
jgi:hypothetical protein